MVEIDYMRWKKFCAGLVHLAKLRWRGFCQTGSLGWKRLTGGQGNRSTGAGKWRGCSKKVKVILKESESDFEGSISKRQKHCIDILNNLKKFQVFFFLKETRLLWTERREEELSLPRLTGSDKEKKKKDRHFGQNSHMARTNEQFTTWLLICCQISWVGYRVLEDRKERKKRLTPDKTRDTDTQKHRNTQRNTTEGKCQMSKMVSLCFPYGR